MPETSTKRTTEKRVEHERLRFRSLVAANPNYFGSFPATGLPVVKLIAGNTDYEDLEGVGYNPATKRLHATIDVKRSIGYSGDLCSDGSLEYVRFFVDHGSGWVDAGIAAANVHDIPAGENCAGDDWHPLTYAVEVPYSPRRRWCFRPQLPRMRAILSWNVEPPEGEPDWTPVYGTVRDCNIQIDKSPFIVDFLDVLVQDYDVPLEVVQSVTPLVPPIPPIPDDVPGVIDLPDPPLPSPPVLLTTAQLATRYARDRGRPTVEPTRFAFAEIEAIKASSSIELAASAEVSSVLAELDIDLGDLVAEIDETTGNISYEELVDVGLDTNQEKLVATYRIKRPSGFSGGLCTAGSEEHVAFWADWDDDCSWTYLGTVSLKSYDFDDLPDGGLCYSVALPVDLHELKQHCSDPKLAQVRAVLSWSTQPSTTDPDDVPTWGNRLDARVTIPPRVGHPGTLTVVGGVSTAYISDVTGMASASAKFSLTGLPVFAPLGRSVPFGGRVVIQGPPIPGKRYRLRVIEGGTSTTLTQSVLVTPTSGLPSWHADDGSGWFDYLDHSDNISGVLGYYDSTSNERVTVVLEIEGVGIVDTQAVQLDNVRPEVAISITEPVGDCGKVAPGTTMTGRVHAGDVHIGRWRVVVDGGPSTFPATPVLSGNVNTPPAGEEWTFDTDDLSPCGYVVRVTAWDRTIRNSGNHQNHRSVDVGFCVDS